MLTVAVPVTVDAAVTVTVYVIACPDASVPGFHRSSRPSLVAPSALVTVRPRGTVRSAITFFAGLGPPLVTVTLIENAPPAGTVALGWICRITATSAPYRYAGRTVWTSAATRTR